MALTSDQLKLVKTIIRKHLNGSAVKFIIDCNECSNAEIDVFDELCRDPQGIALGDRLWIKVKYSVLNEAYEITAGEYR